MFGLFLGLLRAGHRSQGGQVIVLTAITLPVLALVTTGVIEWGQTYAEATQAQRAAQAAAEAIAQQLSPQDMAQPSPPGWATGLASTVVTQMLQRPSAAVSVDWAPGSQQLPTRPGPPQTADVPTQTFAPGSTTFDWEHEHDVTFQLPSYGYAAQPRWEQTYLNYWDEATVGAWTPQWLSGQHGYWDTSIGSASQTANVWGVGSGVATECCIIVWIWICAGKFCFPIPIPIPVTVWMGVFGWGNTGGVPYVFTNWQNWEWRNTGTYSGNVWVPWNWEDWMYRGAWSNPWVHWDRWLQQLGTSPWTNTTDDVGGPVTVGPYSTVSGLGTTQGTVTQQGGYTSRMVQVTVQAPVRALTPLFSAILPSRVIRYGMAQAAQ